jgi:transcriptional regulator GlxA family with amidase domain
MRVIPDVTIETCPELDIICIPGGWGTRAEIKNNRVIQWIASCGRRATTVTSVCTGAMLLGQAGLLKGRRATTHWRSLPWMRESFTDVTVVDNEHVVTDGNVVKSF